MKPVRSEAIFSVSFPLDAGKPCTTSFLSFLAWPPLSSLGINLIPATDELSLVFRCKQLKSKSIGSTRLRRIEEHATAFVTMNCCCTQYQNCKQESSKLELRIRHRKGQVEKRGDRASNEEELTECGSMLFVLPISMYIWPKATVTPTDGTKKRVPDWPLVSETEKKLRIDMDVRNSAMNLSLKNKENFDTAKSRGPLLQEPLQEYLMDVKILIGPETRSTSTFLSIASFLGYEN